MQKLFACLIKETRAVVILKCVNYKQKKKKKYTGNNKKF